MPNLVMESTKVFFNTDNSVVVEVKKPQKRKVILLFLIIVGFLGIYFLSPHFFPLKQFKETTNSAQQTTQSSQSNATKPSATEATKPSEHFLPASKDGVEARGTTEGLAVTAIPEIKNLTTDTASWVVNANVAQVWSNETTRQGTDLLTEFVLGEEVITLVEKGNRFKVQGVNYTGWVDKNLLLPPEKTVVFQTYVLLEPKIVVTEVDGVNVYLFVDQEWYVLPLSYGTILPKLGGFGDYTIVLIPNSNRDNRMVGFIKNSFVELWEEKDFSVSLIDKETVIREGKKFLGKPYLWGGTSSITSVDCSGLWYLVLRRLGYAIPRDASDQAKFFDAYTVKGSYERGDLVYFGPGGMSAINHTALYLGDGMILHSTVQDFGNGVMEGNTADGGRIERIVRVFH